MGVLGREAFGIELLEPSRVRFLKFAVQGLSIDAENGGRFGLVTIHTSQHHAEVFALDLIETHAAGRSLVEHPGQGLFTGNARRHVRDRDSLVPAQDHSTLDNVLQLADIARPRVPTETLLRLGVDGWQWLAALSRGSRQKVP